MSPTISVVMPVFNAERYIEEALRSLLNQTFGDFEIILLDDESTDDTMTIARSFEDSRIRFVSSRHVGIVHLLNHGISLAKGHYIARMDGDDICERNRFAKQVDYLNENPAISLCASNVALLENDAIWTYPNEHEDIVANLLFSNCIAHPTVMIRQSVFEQTGLQYRAEFLYAEDYALWAELSQSIRMHILPDRLLCYRIHEGQVSQAKLQQQRQSQEHVHRMLLDRFGIPYTDEEFVIHTTFKENLGSTELHQWFDRILAYNQTAKRYKQDSLERVISNWAVVSV